MKPKPPTEIHAAQLKPNERRTYEAKWCEVCDKVNPHWRLMSEPDAPYTCGDCGTINAADYPTPPAVVEQAAALADVERTPTEAPATPQGPERVGADMTRAERVEVVRQALTGLHQVVQALSWTGEDFERILPELSALASRCVSLPFLSAEKKLPVDGKPTNGH